MKRICFFNSHPAWGGGVKFYIEHAIGMQALGYEISAVCSRNSDLSKAYQKAGIHQLNISVSGRSLMNPFKVLKLIRFYRQNNIEAVVFTTSEDLKLGGITAKIAGVPIIAYRRGLAVPIKNRFSNQYLFKNVLTHIMANSEETKRTILQHLGDHLNADRIKVIYNGLDTTNSTYLESNPALTENSSGFIIGNAGRLVEQKGHKYLIEIARLLKSRGFPFTLLIAGAGPLENDLRQQIAAAGLTNEVRILGYIADIPRFMASLDVFVLTSVWEGFGYVIVEAMLAKKPVIAFKTSSNPEIIIEGETGLLVDYPDIVTFADKIQALEKNPERRHIFGLNGRKSAIKRFEMETQILKFVDFINS